MNNFIKTLLFTALLAPCIAIHSGPLQSTQRRAITIETLDKEINSLHRQIFALAPINTEEKRTQAATLRMKIKLLKRTPSQDMGDKIALLELERHLADEEMGFASKIPEHLTRY